ncbi:hypothetical protein GUITHDRAFT_111081 [Guillardia theta CCMP2712]|uniref:Uncharacterized protein n=1 Tax=Guillardia theta (strain CCMP2712) TaxID=905079 RepID=L1J3D1_GUITC|nr:hypothetical protein GUITHDRAFT_111081 [Guillardia theta CCMP2712]EKX43038.1 hypothetical protein GUITHDRAFT_111081 [Guillardia theta CCMP2712]|eukprot:XP_005830018.1 hypothetical protein GUITHDRAFT_111081 [Guillardia theta CCMP2712]
MEMEMKMEMEMEIDWDRGNFNSKTLAGIAALLALVGVVGIATIHVRRSELLVDYFPVQVVNIPRKQILYVGAQCEASCKDNFLKCTHGLGQREYPSDLSYYPPNQAAEWTPTATGLDLWKQDILHCYQLYQKFCMPQCANMF